MEDDITFKDHPTVKELIEEMGEDKFWRMMDLHMTITDQQIRRAMFNAAAQRFTKEDIEKAIADWSPLPKGTRSLRIVKDERRAQEKQLRHAFNYGIGNQALRQTAPQRQAPKYKQFIVFAHDDYPEGGLADIEGSYDDAAEAVAVCDTGHTDYQYVVDRDTWEVLHKNPSDFNLGDL